MAYLGLFRLVVVGAVLGVVAGCGGGGSSGGGGGGAGGEGGEGAADDVAITVADTAVDEGDSGRTDLTFTVKLSRPSDGVVRVAYATRDVSAFADGVTSQGRGDYDATSGTLRFEPGETEQTVDVGVMADELNEADEIVKLVLSKPLSAVLEDAEAEGTIANDDDVPVASVESGNVAEGNSGVATVDLTISLSVASGRATSVDWATIDGDALNGEDYLAAMGAAVFAPGETSKTIQVPILGDTLDELDESFDVELSNAQNVDIAEPTGTLTIIDDDLPGSTEPSLSIGNATITEGNAGSKQLTFTVDLSVASDTTVAVDYASIDGSATAGGLAATGGVDYVAASDSVTFAPGETSKQIAVTINGDTLNEANETVLVELFNPSNAIVLQPQGVGTINNDDALPSVTISNVSVAEGAAGVRTANFAVSLSPPSGRGASVTFATSDSTASAGVDYVAASGTIDFDPGQTSAYVSISVYGDLLNEADETFYVDLGTVTNAAINDDQALGTISNDDAVPQLTIDDVSLLEGDAGTKLAVFSVGLSAESGQAVSVAFATSDDTATAPSDYVAASGSLSFPAGTTVRTVSVTVKGDVLDEATEAFSIDLSSPVHALIADGHGVGTIITDDTTLPALSIADATITEGNAGTSTLTFSVTLDAVSTQQVKVSYTTVNDTAVAVTDYQATSGTLTFDPGQTSKTIDVTINGDTLHEPDEVFLVSLSSPVNAFVADAAGGGSIDNDDTAPTLSIDNVTLSEGNAGTKNATFTITLSAASGFPVSVSYATADGTAEEGGSAALGADDYEASSDVIVLAPGETTAQVTVAVNGDILTEGSETFTVQLTAALNASIADGVGQATISNDDALATISINDVSDVEGDAGSKAFTFTVTLSKASGSQVSVDFATANGSASSGGDYTAAAGTVVFNPGETTATIAVIVKGDNAAEAHNDETFFVNLSNAMGATIADAQGLGIILSDD